MTSLYDGLEQVDAPPPGTPSTASAAAPPRAAAPKPGLYDGLEVVQEQSPDVLAAPPRAAQTIGESFQAGVQGSSGGLLWRQKLPDLMAKEHESFWEGLARSAGGLAGDIIPMTAGAVALGGVGATMGSAVAPGAGTLVGGLVGSGAGMGFVPAALRESLIMAFRSGEIRDKADWWNELRKAATRVMAETATSAATMGVIGAAGRVTGRLIAPMIGESLSVPTQVAGKKAAEGLATGVLSSAELAATILAFPTIPALLDLRLPSMAEIGHSAIIIGGLKGAHITAERVADIFAKTGKTPAEQVADAQQDPKLAGEIADVPRGTSVPAKMDKLLADAERLANPEPVLPKNLGELAVPSGEAPRAGAPPIMDLVGKAEQLANVIPEAPRVRDLIQNLKDRGPLATDVTDDLQSMVAAVERLDALPRTELTPAEKTEQTDLRAKVAELESKVRSIPTEAEHDASAKVVYNDVMDQLAALEKSRADAGQTPLYDKPPEAIAKLVQRQVETQARMWGVLPEEIYQERYPSFKNVRERPERSIARAAARAERVLEQDQADLDFTKSGGYGGGREEIRSPAQAEELPATVGGGRPEQGWAGATRIRGAAGPLEVYRGGGQPLAVDHFGPEALGKASGNPSSGLGVWFTNTESEAATYGTVERAFLDMRNPKYIRIEDLPGFDNVADAQAYAEKLRQQGYDGIIVDAQHLGGKTHFVAFHPDTVIPNTPTLFQSSQEKLQSVAGLPRIATFSEKNWAGKTRWRWGIGNAPLKPYGFEELSYPRSGTADRGLTFSSEEQARTAAIEEVADNLGRWQGPDWKERLGHILGGAANDLRFGEGDKTLFQDKPLWYSALARQISEAKMNQAPAQGWKDLIRGMKGVKADEIKWSGIEDWLDARKEAGDRVTKEEVNAFLEQNGVKVTETALGGEDSAKQDAIINDLVAKISSRGYEADLQENEHDGGFYLDSIRRRSDGRSWDHEAIMDERAPAAIQDLAMQLEDALTAEDRGVVGGQTKFESYTLPGAKAGSYRELLLTLPPKVTVREELGEPRTMSLEAGAREIGLGAEDLGPVGTQVMIYPHGLYMTKQPDGQYHVVVFNDEYLGRSLRDAENFLVSKMGGEVPSQSATPQFRSSHFNEPNILAHVRFDERTAPADGPYKVTVSERGGGRGNTSSKTFKSKLEAENFAEVKKAGGYTATVENTGVHRVLFIEEIQSDWAQQGKKRGFAEQAYPEIEKSIIDGSRIDDLDDAVRGVQDAAGITTGDGAGMYFSGSKAERWARETPQQREQWLRDWLRDETGFGNNTKVPLAPFVGKTEAWVALTLKRMIRYAAENGFDRVAWTTGAQQAERYTSALRKSVDEIEWKKTDKGVQIVGYKGKIYEESSRLRELRRRDAEGALTSTEGRELQILSREQAGRDRTKVVDTTEKETSLSDAIGKAMAEKILSDPNPEGKISGESIMVSDTGMANFYDRIVPNIANDVLKKLGGGKVGEVVLGKSEGEKLYRPDIVEAAIEYMNRRSTPEELREAIGDVRISDAEIDDALSYNPAGGPASRAREVARQFADEIVRRAAGQKRSGQQGFDITPQMREKALEGMPLFQRNAEIHRAAYQVNARLISTFETADQSSILHELGHHFLEDMKYFAAKPDAPARVKEMWDTARQEFAIGEGEIPAASHELMARSFERYLGDGEAPTPALAAMFAQFKEWILSVYKDIKNIAGVNISPEVKKLFDRMLATDEEIKAAQELGVPRSYAPEAMANEARKIVPGFKAEQASMEPYADSIPKGPGEAPNDSHINYAYIDSPLRVQLTMQKMAEIDQANIQKQRGGAEGVKSWAESNAQQAKYVNDILGGSPDTLRLLSDRDPEAPGPDVKLGILKKLSVGAAQNAARLRDVILQKGHDATVVDQLQYLGSLETMRVIQAEFLGERAGVARALNALKDASGGDEQAFAKMLASISTGSQELFQSSRTPEQEQALLKAKLDEILARYSGKSTLDIAKLHKEIGTLKGSFKVVKDMEKASTWQMLVEVWKAGLLSGPQTPVTNIVGTSAFQFMRPLVDAIAAGIGTARGARVGMGAEDRISMAEPFARVYSMLAGIQEGLINGYHALKVEGTTGKTEQYREAIPGRLGSVIRFPFRLMSAGDVITTTMYKRGEMKTLAMRQALGEGLGLSSRELNVRVQELMDNPTAQMEFIGDEASTRMAFNAPGGDKMRSLQKFVHDWSLEWMIPFIRTPLNITTELARMSPFAPLAAQWRADIAKGGVARDRAIAEVVLGSGIMSLTMAMAFSGQLTGAGSPDQGKNRGKAGVEQPYSWKIGDTWYEYARIQPMGTLVGMATDLAKIWDHLNDEEKDKIPKMLATAFANAVTNQTFLQGITNFVNASSDPTRFGPRFLQQFSASMVPNIIGQPTAMADPVVREVNGMLDAVKARIPGFRQELLPKRDWLGEAVQTKERMGAVLPVREQKISDDKVRLEAARLDISMAATPKKTHVGKGTGKIGDVEFTPEEQDTFAKVGGKMAHEILGNIVSSPGYDDIPDLVKRRIFSRVLSASHQVAAAAALPPEKRVAYLQSITEKMQAELAPAQEGQ